MFEDVWNLVQIEDGLYEDVIWILLEKQYQKSRSFLGFF